MVENMLNYTAVECCCLFLLCIMRYITIPKLMGKIVLTAQMITARAIKLIITMITVKTCLMRLNGEKLLIELPNNADTQSLILMFDVMFLILSLVRARRFLKESVMSA